MRNEQEGLDAAKLFTGATNEQFPLPDADDRTEHPAQDQRAENTAVALPDVPHELSPEIKKAMLAAGYAQMMLDRLAALQNEEVAKYTGISRSELGLRVWNAPLAEVASRLGIKQHVLRRICTLFEVPIPPKGYFKTSFANRPIRWTRVAVAGDGGKL